MAEYREVLLRKKIRSLQELRECEIDSPLIVYAANAIVRDPGHLRATSATALA
ncbi:MAG TPA: hypothetical protein VNG69_15060 [Casimicrobiaceae bacterium]|nr:hypothetical protein [Casimicrobiaceae bacterium]